jgi:AcrR family transcriptional regulator
MPKVDKEYFDRKKNHIVDAAIRVCQRKPMYAATLRDVIRESGISPGGMYCYFSSIDEIFAAIADRCYRESTPEEGVEKIFESGENPETIIEAAFSCWGQIIDKMNITYGKIVSEFDTIYFNEPERAKKIAALMTSENIRDKIEAMLPAFIDKHIRSGYFKPTVPKEYIFLVAATSMHGIKWALPFSSEVKEFHDFIGIDNEHRSAQGMAVALSKLVIDSLKNERAGGRI